MKIAVLSITEVMSPAAMRVRFRRILVISQRRSGPRIELEEVHPNAVGDWTRVVL